MNVLGEVPHDLSAEFQTDLFKKKWDQTTDRSGNALLKTAFSRLKRSLVLIFLLNLLAATLEGIMPFILREIISYIQDEDPARGKDWAIFLTGFMLASLLIARVVRDNLSFMNLTAGVTISQALAGLVYSKTLKLSAATNKTYK